MPGTIPDPVWLYRIVHYQNVAYILKNGIGTCKHVKQDPNYIDIGNAALITKRANFRIPSTDYDYGYLGDYVPFYFGYLSPMLLNIKTGYGGVTKRPQSDIIYLICDLSDIVKAGCRFIFTDRHAKGYLATFYTNLSDLNKVDWKVVNAQRWCSDELDPDRMQRKQAEFLVHNYVPAKCVRHIVVYNKEKANFISELVRESGLSINVHIDPNNKFYYR